ncbi:MAG: response regulator [Lachnospiraceae bacterium]|nr:response regulator [Lachnospiraceae bacterium]
MIDKKREPDYKETKAMKKLDYRVDLQVSMLLAVFVAAVALSCFAVSYTVTYRDMKTSLRERVEYIHEYLGSQLDLSAFSSLETKEDMNAVEYQMLHQVFRSIREATGVMYLYTAKKTDDGKYIYVVDGLSPDSEDFRYPGDLIEEEIYQEMDRALGGEKVYPDEIVHTSWGDIFICYLPLYDQKEIVGVLGIEFEAEHQYHTYQKLKAFVPLAVLLFTVLAFFTSRRMFRRVNEIVERQNEQKEILVDALHNAEVASKAKASFLFNISHDIQTPMNAIVGFIRLARDHAGDERQVMEYLHKVERASNHLRRLINDVLDMARLERGNLELELAPCDILVSARETEQLFRPKMEEKGLSFEVRLDRMKHSFVLCDSLRMKQIAMNLLSNALEYTMPGGNVLYEIRETGYDEGQVSLSMRVRDTGIGMSEEFQEHIFGVFEREKSATESGVQGTGLGLAITRQLVELQGGTIEVYSKKGEGTEFVVRFQLKTAKEEDLPGAPVKDKGRFEERRLLLIEDNPLNQEVAKMLLMEEGFLVECAGDGLEGVEMVCASPPGYYDLILMDIQMPKMNGYEATRKIRALERPDLRSIPIVALTANAFEEDRKEAFAAGMNGHIAKPFDLEKVNEVLKDFF